MKVFVINLKNSRRRRESIISQLSALSLDFEIFEAIDGANFERDEILDFYLDKTNEAPQGFLACGLSHYNLYKKIVEEEISLSLILEDDVILSKTLPKILDVIEKEIEDNEIVLLHAQAVHSVNLTTSQKIELPGKFTLYYTMPFHGGLGSTAAYIIPLSVARTFTKDFPISSNVDSWGPKMKRGFFEYLKIVYPYPVIPAMVPSDINYIDERTWKHKIKLISNATPVIKQVLQYLRYRRWKKSQRLIQFVKEEPIASSNYFK